MRTLLDAEEPARFGQGDLGAFSFSVSVGCVPRTTQPRAKYGTFRVRGTHSTELEIVSPGRAHLIVDAADRDGKGDG